MKFDFCTRLDGMETYYEYNDDVKTCVGRERHCRAYLSALIGWDGGMGG